MTRHGYIGIFVRAIEIVSQFAFNPYSLAVSHKPGQPALRHDNDNDRCLNLLDNGSEKARVPFFLLFFFSRYDSAICKSLNNLEFHLGFWCTDCS